MLASICNICEYTIKDALEFLHNFEKTDPPVKKTKQWGSKIHSFITDRNHMPYEEDKIQGLEEEEEPKKKKVMK